ncbi:MAG: hypothetical protein HN891_05020 [Planctomycetes bacterium]|nr:hypothetical protein [Planctomycetota bacterium]MBT6453326.1 hypothetical protein [Planctomycetota bacterium]MBT6540008.1 hypothetical protein [Planctomycetota bacterium]MBT6783586.1 hypothetical protein [Planctomycetota bacterium]MBT6967679.1 hypothetical protein [Planctomycetota bacterium]
MITSRPIPTPPVQFGDLDRWLASFTSWEQQIPLAKDRRSLSPGRCRDLLERASICSGSSPVIQVAGTKGKGSTVLWMESLLRIRSVPCAATLSPHLQSIVERIRIDGVELTEQAILQGLRKIHPFLIDSSDPSSVPPTFFDLWIALFAQQASEAGDRWWLVEVGLGGPLDSTSAIPHDVGVLTTIDLDHRAILGDTIDQIAAEKARIATAGKPMVIAQGPGNDCAFDVARRRGSLPFIVSEDSRIPGHIQTPQRLNASCALAALESNPDQPPWSVDEINLAAQQLELPGRLERIEGRLPLLLDGAHTPRSLQIFADEFARYRSSSTGALLIGMLADKDLRSNLSALTRLQPAPEMMAVTPPSHRGLPAAELASMLEQLGFECHFEERPEQGLEWLMKKAADGEPTAATGSMFLAGWVRQHWPQRDRQASC